MARLTGDDVLEQIGASIGKALVDHKVAEEAATNISVSVTQELRMLMGGQTVYFPKAITAIKEKRDKEIFWEFDGCNYQALAMKHGVSEMRIRQIIEKMTEIRRQTLKAGLADPLKNPLIEVAHCQ